MFIASKSIHESAQLINLDKSRLMATNTGLKFID